MAQEVLEVAAPVFKTVVAIGGANAGVRIFVTTALQKIGAHDPRWDRYWPRLPWRPVWRARIACKQWVEENFKEGEPNAGKASSLTQLATPFRPGHSLIGRVKLPWNLPYYGLIGEKSERHTLYIASPRSGKSLQLQTALANLPLDACAVVVDPKGHHTNDVLIPLERQGHELVVIDPLAILKRVSQSINLIRQIDFINRRLGQDMTTMLCNRMADASFPQAANEKQFFTNVPRELWARLICFGKQTIPGCTMMDIRKLLNVGLIEGAPDDPELAMLMLWEAMRACDAYDGYVSSVGAQMLSMDARTRENVLATARSKTAFWDHHQVQSVSAENDVDLTDLKNPDSNVIISLVAPVGEIRTTLKPWFGQIISLSLAIMELIPGDLKTKTQFVLEEVQALGGGTLQGVGESFPLLPGYGASVTAVAQDIPGLRKAFPDDWESMIGSAQHVVFMASNDPETFNFIAENAFGTRTVRRKKWRIPFLWTVERYEQPVITPDQVRRLLEVGRSNAVVMRNGKRSMIVKTALSYKTLPVWMLDPSMDHGETFLRRFTRKVIQARRARSKRPPTPAEAGEQEA